jgi:Raf kinase inhibitor-like YbhB/YbcL family protein
VRPFIFFLIAALILVYLSNAAGKEVKKMGELKITSSAFEHNGTIPARYTCDGADINPPLHVSNTPSGTKSLALIVDDPDAPMGTWVHWVAWNIDPATSEIKENTVPAGAMEGMNDFRKHNYGGPCPPSGTHRYFFKIYALDTRLDPDSNADKAALEKAMKGHILGQAELMGKYKRTK